MLTAQDLKNRRIAHLIVDMQDECVAGLGPDDRDLPARIAGFVARTRAVALPVYIETPAFGASVIPRLPAWPDVNGNDQPAETVQKFMSSGFVYTVSGGVLIPSDLDRTLQRYQIDTLLVSGVNTRICAWETARDGALRGYHTTLLEGLCADETTITRSKTYPAITREFAAASGVCTLSAGAFEAMIEVAAYSTPAPARPGTFSPF